MRAKRANAAICAALSMAISSCKKAVQLPEGGAIAVLVDRTLSTAHRSGEYAKYFNGSIIASLRPGERILVESISDQSTLSDPPLRAVDTTLPAIKAPEWTLNDDFQSYSRNCHRSAIPQIAAYSAAIADVQSHASVTFTPNNLATRSFILDGIEEEAQFLAHQSGHKVLVVFTDGIEDSQEYGQTLKFDQPGFWSQNSPEKLIATLKKQNRLPNLSGVTVYFIGAAANRPEDFRDNQRFWKEYFIATGLSERDLHYGHSPSWEEPYLASDIDSALCSDAAH